MILDILASLLFWVAFGVIFLAAGTYLNETFDRNDASTTSDLRKKNKALKARKANLELSLSLREEENRLLRSELALRTELDVLLLTHDEALIKAAKLDEVIARQDAAHAANLEGDSNV